MAARIYPKIMKYVMEHPNRVLSASRITSRVGGSTGGVVNALRNWAKEEPKLEFVKIGSGRYINVKYNDPDADRRQPSRPAAQPASSKGTIGVALSLTLEEGQPPITISEHGARQLYMTLKRMFGSE